MANGWPRPVAQRRDEVERVQVDVDIADNDVVLRIQASDRSAAEKSIFVAGAKLAFEGPIVLDHEIFLQPAAARQAAEVLVAAAEALEAADGDARAGSPPDPGQAPSEEPLPDPSSAT